MKEKTKWILVLVVKRRKRANSLFGGFKQNTSNVNPSWQSKTVYKDVQEKAIRGFNFIRVLKLTGF